MKNLQDISGTFIVILVILSGLSAPLSSRRVSFDRPKITISLPPNSEERFSRSNPSQNGTLRHTDINLVLSQRAQEKIDKYRAGYAAQDMRRAFLPAVVSTSGRIHGDLLRLLYLLADNKTKRHFRDLDEAIDVDSDAYCWRRRSPHRTSIYILFCLSLSFCLVQFLHAPTTLEFPGSLLPVAIAAIIMIINRSRLGLANVIAQ